MNFAEVTIKTEDGVDEPAAPPPKPPPPDDEDELQPLTLKHSNKTKCNRLQRMKTKQWPPPSFVLRKKSSQSVSSLAGRIRKGSDGSEVNFITEYISKTLSTLLEEWSELF